MVNALHEHGNILFLGGTAGNPTSQAEFQGASDVIKKYPGMHWLIDSPVTTGWDPETEQQVMSGLLTKYHNINGIITDYGGSATGAISAFVQAGRKLVPMTANDYNEFSCDYYSLHKTNPDFQIGTVSSRTWIVRDALRQGVAAQEGTKDPEPNLLELPLIENSLVGGKLAPKCDKSLPPDAILSSELTGTQLAKLFGK
jgi:ribose transport system substrate-binding protein